tara:strand:+ start:1195 stop:1440 length:246 start_codon:yes stop_codon:yes gene_type:complete
MSSRIGEVEVGDLVVWGDNPGAKYVAAGAGPGVVLDVKMVRYHSYLPQEQVAIVLWENGGTKEVSSMNLCVLEDSPSSSLG